MPLIRKVVKGIGSGIGLAREAYLDRQETKALQKGAVTSPTTPSQSSVAEGGSSSAINAADSGAPPPYLDLPAEEADRLVAAAKAVPVSEYVVSDEKKTISNGDDSESSEDEAELLWQLDEAAEAADPPAYDSIVEEEAHDSAAPSDEDDEDSNQKLIQRVLDIASPPPNTIPRLEAPVIIPQRRPRAKDRGFVRAYSPVLADSGINQEAFLMFLKSLSKAAAPSKGLMAVFIAAQIVGNVPEMTAQIVSVAVSLTVGTTIELRKRYKANAYLDEINAKFFRPRGKFATIIAFKPDQQRPIESGEFNPNQVIAQYSAKTGNTMKDGARNLRTSSGKAYGELELGSMAPLVFPILDQAASNPDSSKFKRANKFMQEYYDRRAQAQFSADNPDSSLAAKPQFRSRYSDPNHPANSGSLISLVTGGHINPNKYKDARRNRRREMTGRKALKPNEPKGFIGRMLRQDVAYLLVVDMPSEQELAAAREQLELMKQQKAENSWWQFGRTKSNPGTSAMASSSSAAQ